MKEVLKLALEALLLMHACYVNPKWVSHKQQESQILEQTLATITAIKEALAQPEEAQSALSLFQSGFIDGREKGLKEALAQPEQDNTYVYASRLATAIWQKHYIKDSPKWKPLDTTEGVLTQIDNMTCGLVREKPSQPEQEPVALASHGVVNWIADKQFQHEADLYTTPPQRTWVEQKPVAWLQFKENEPPVVVPRDLGTPVFLGIRGGLAHDTQFKEKNT